MIELGLFVAGVLGGVLATILAVKRGWYEIKR